VCLSLICIDQSDSCINEGQGETLYMYKTLYNVAQTVVSHYGVVVFICSWDIRSRYLSTQMLGSELCEGAVLFCFALLISLDVH
jgi:hypothetical protein